MNSFLLLSLDIFRGFYFRISQRINISFVAFTFASPSAIHFSFH